MKVSRPKNKTPINASQRVKNETLDVVFEEIQQPEHDATASEILHNDRVIALAEAHEHDKTALAVRSTKQAWSKKLDKHVSEDLLLARHHELLNARKKEVIVVGYGFAKEVRVVDLGVDVGAVSKGLELGYKLRGKLTGDAPPVPVQNNYNLFFMPKVQADVRAFEDKLIESITNENKTTDVEAVAVEPDAGADK